MYKIISWQAESCSEKYEPTHIRRTIEQHVELETARERLMQHQERQTPAVLTDMSDKILHTTG